MATNEANDPHNKEQQRTAAGTSSAQTTGKPQGAAAEQGKSQATPGKQSGEEHMQSKSGTNAGSKSQESQARNLTPTNGGGQRQPEQQRQRGMAPRSWFEFSPWMDSPFGMMRRFSEEMDRLFDDVWRGRGLSRSRQGGRAGQTWWSPQIEMYEKDNQLVVCTDLPGLKQEDIELEMSDNMLTIKGERRNDFEDNQQGYYHSERSYGSFLRTIPLPEGVDGEKAKASFENGVLKVMFPLPPQQQQQKRRIEVEAGSAQHTGAEKPGSSSQ